MKPKRPRTELPRYVTRPSDLNGSPSDLGPRRSETGRQWAEVSEGAQYFFAVPANEEKLNQLCNKFLNEPQRALTPRDRYVYRVSTAHVFLVFEQNGIMQSSARARAVCTYAAASFWIPAKRSSDEGVVFFPFYVFVSKEGYPLIASTRESNGWPTEPAEVNLPAEGSSGDFTVRATLLKTFSRDTRAERDCLFRVSPQGANHSPATLYPIIRALGGDFGERLFRALRGEKVHLDVKFALLKQFRDTAHPKRACYQAVAETKAEAKVDKAEVLGTTFKLTITKADSHPIVEEFGVPEHATRTGPACVIDEILGVKLDMRAQMFSLSELHRSAD